MNCRTPRVSLGRLTFNTIPARLHAASKRMSWSTPPAVTAIATAVAVTAPPLRTKISAVSIARLSNAGAKAAAVKREMLLRMPENSETRLISSRYGKVIRVR
jgi:hypothetical protein